MCWHFLFLQTHPGIFKQTRFRFLAFFVRQASHDSGVGALVGSAVGKLVGSAVGSAVGATGISLHCLLTQLHPRIFKQFFLRLFAFLELHFLNNKDVGASVLDVGFTDGEDVADGP